MAANLNDFLVLYYRQLSFNDMPAAVRAQYDAYAKNEDFRGNMKKWKEDLINSANGTNNDLPDAMNVATFDQNDWEKFFKAFQNAFRDMAADKKAFKDEKKPNEFLDEYFGDQKLFSLFKAPAAVANHIEELNTLLNGPYKEDLFSRLQAGGIFETRSDFNEFLHHLTDKKYDSDTKVRNKLLRVANFLYRALDNDDFKKNPRLENAVRGVNLTAITSGFDDTGNVDPDKLAYFKRNYNSLLRTLYKDAKTRDVFANYDNGKITGPLKEALGKTDYNNKDSKDYIPPKRTDELTLGQQISDWWGNTYEDSLEKFVKLRGDRLYIAPEAQAIVKAIDGAKIKPTDGLEKILAESGKIKENLLYKSPKAAEAFEYFEKIMKELQGTMKHAFKGALHSGRQMHALIEEMVISAVKNGKIKEAKIAMEVLSVIKYGYTTSKIMDAIGKEKLSIFSDPGLSWNKTEGVKFVTTAFDKSLKAALMGVGYGITIVGNAINLSGTKFKGKPGRLMDPRNNWRTQNEDNRQDAATERNKNVTQRDQINADMDQTRARGITEATVGAAITTLEGEINTLESDINRDNNTLINWLNDPANQTSPDYNPLSADLQTKQRQLGRKEKKRQYFQDGAESVAFLTEQITARDTQIAEWDDKHKDEYLDLMAHWDFLETGRKVHTWSLSTKNARKKFNDHKKDQMKAWTDDYSYTA